MDQDIRRLQRDVSLVACAEVVKRVNALTRGPYGRLLNFNHACLKLERKEKRDGRTVRVYGAPRTPLARVPEGVEATAETNGGWRPRRHG